MTEHPHDLGARRLTKADPRLWAVLALAAVFLGLGALFVLSPSTGAAIFGLPAPGGLADGYLRAIGFRDLALALYLAGLAFLASRRSVSIVLGSSLVIPVCDTILVWSSGAAPWQIALHLGSGAVLLVLTLWVSGPRQAPHRSGAPDDS